MRLTKNHVLFWESKQVRPSWVRALEDSDDARVRRMQFIHQCINDHDARYSAHLFAYRERYQRAHNTIVLLKHTRKRGKRKGEFLEAHLNMWARSLNSNNPHRINARRWLRRLYQAERKIQLTAEGMPR